MGYGILDYLSDVVESKGEAKSIIWYLMDEWKISMKELKR